MNSAKIMIVEDEFIIAEDIKGVLIRLGYSVVGIAFTGTTALKKIEESLPDLVLMDIMLKGDMDGIEVASLIKEKFNIPVIYLTAYTDDTTLQRAKTTEAFGYILKPFEDRELYTNIELALYKHKAEKEIRKKQQTLQIIADFDEYISFLSLNTILENTFKFLLKYFDLKNCSIILFDEFKNEYKRYISKIDNNNIFIEIEENIENGIKELFIDIINGISGSIYKRNITESEIQTHKILNDYLLSRGFNSYFLLQLHIKDKFIGSLNIASEQTDGIPEETQQILELLSHRLSLSIQNSSLFQDLVESENKFKNFANSLPQTVIEADFENKINYANDNALKIFGYTREELDKGLFINQMIYKEDISKYYTLVENLITGNGKNNLEFTAITKEGVCFPVAAYSNIIFRKNIPVGILSIILDMSEHKKSEEEMLKVKKLESIGILAGGIAHDFNNILTAILGNITLGKVYSDPNDKIFEILTEAEKACIRSKDLTQQLLTFSKGGIPVKKIGSIKDLIIDSVQFLLRGSNIKSEYFFQEGLSNVEVDEGQINQVINNLIINAIQAMPNGGYIRIRCENVLIKQNDITNFKEGMYVKIAIKDEGSGISKDYINKIFDPYFTTKQKGSGLGLAVTYSIINKHNGYINVESELGKGTTFYIYLPASNTTETIKEKKEQTKNTHTGKILIMDDEELIRDVTSKILTNTGYTVETSEDGEKAIELYKKAFLEEKPYDVVIMDLTIPGGIGGKEAIKILLDFDPSIKAIVTSGYSTDMVMNNYKEHGFKAVIVKPYRMEEIIHTLDTIIASD